MTSSALLLSTARYQDALGRLPCRSFYTELSGVGGCPVAHDHEDTACTSLGSSMFLWPPAVVILSKGQDAICGLRIRVLRRRLKSPFEFHPLQVVTDLRNASDLRYLRAFVILRLS